MSEFPSLTAIIPDKARKIYIAYSGGVDSHVLLHYAAVNPLLHDKIQAIYINHGLQAQAEDWGRHCSQRCLELDVALKIITVEAKPISGEGPEAAARNARYAAFRGLLQEQEVLLFAHHREDQMETLMLQLFRGCGLPGLAAMPKAQIFGHGTLIRPLLEVAKPDIQLYAKQHQLCWVEDPSNQNCHFDRNFLRNEIIPLLKQRWPSLDKTVARTARHCANAEQLLDDWLKTSFTELYDKNDRSLLIDKWRLNNENQQNWLLRYWLHVLGLKPPSEAKLQSIIAQMIYAKADATPKVLIQNHVVSKYKSKLFCINASFFNQEPLARNWPIQDTELKMPNGYSLKILSSCSGIDKLLWHTQTVTVEVRRGGEKLKLPYREGSHCLKKLYQEAEVPPWERDLRPLIYLNGRLAAVAGLWVAEWAWSQQQDGCYQLIWQA